MDSRPDRTPVPHRLPRWTIWLIPSIVLVGAFFLLDEGIGDWWARFSETMATPDAFRSWVEGFGAWGPVAFLLAQAAQVIVVPIPGTLLPPVGALAFGPWPALALSLAGMALGSAVVFLVARRWGRPLAVRWAGVERVQRYESVVTARGNLLIWLVFLLPFFPDDAACALAGLSSIGFRRFMLIAIVGRIPAVAFGVFTMAGLEGAPGWVWASAAAVLVVVLWLGMRFGPALEGLLVQKVGRETTDENALPDDTDTPGVSARNETKPNG